MKKKICLVIANYYPKISNDLIAGATLALKKNGLKSINKAYAPGVFEIPIIISKLIKKYDAFVALGCVIKGKTPHFNFISRSSIDAIMNLSIVHNKPIGNGILTCNNKKQATERANPFKKNKGGEAANAIIAILKI
jgi:6,7-dimethyl-8-ribityllumazine synthase